MKKWSIFLLLVLSCACSSRQVSDHYTGATEQRLTAHSINDLMEKLPEKDFSELQGKKVFLECFFLNNIEPLAYSKERFRLELMDTWDCRMVPEKTDADITVQIFFTALGTDLDKFGISLPEMILPGAGGLTSIDIISLEMFHGVSELYYYFLDPENHIIFRGKPVKAIVRNDTLKLPVISIPINTVK